jgi:hypothetical protein
VRCSPEPQVGLSDQARVLLQRKNTEQDSTIILFHDRINGFIEYLDYGSGKPFFRCHGVRILPPEAMGISFAVCDSFAVNVDP